MTTVVVGAGLFGSVIAKHLRSLGEKVVVVDDSRPNAGSKPAACLMKPGWASSMVGSDYRLALDLLDSHYGVQHLKLGVLGKVGVGVDWVPPASILQPPDVVGRVTDISPTVVEFVDSKGHNAIAAEHIVVATGVWAGELVPELKGRVSGRGGWAFIWDDEQIDEPFLKMWAPYRQLIAFNRSPTELWVGDGTALTDKSFVATKMVESMKRCGEAVGRPYIETGGPRVVGGWRPYVDGPKAPAFLKNISDIRRNIWVATGGAKNGTLGAAWCARKIAEAIR